MQLRALPCVLSLLPHADVVDCVLLDRAALTQLPSAAALDDAVRRHLGLRPSSAP